MSCDLERLSAWLDGEVAPNEGREVERHLATCPSCSEWIEEAREVSRALAGDPAPVVPEGVVATLVAAIPEPPRPTLLDYLTRFWKARLAIPAPALAGAAALAFALFALWPSRSPEGPPSFPGAMAPPPRVRLTSRPFPRPRPRPLVLIEYGEDTLPVTGASGYGPRTARPMAGGVTPVSYDPSEDESRDHAVVPPPPPPWRVMRPRGRRVVYEETTVMPAWKIQPARTY